MFFPAANPATQVDFIHNGAGSSSMAATLLQHNMDPGCLRPVLGDDGNSYITLNSGRVDPKTGKPIYVPKLVRNANAVLRIRDWMDLDQAILEAGRPPMQAFTELRGANTHTIQNGMGKTVLEHQTQSYFTGADVGMDGLRRTAGDRPLYGSATMPLPIISRDFDFSLRHVAASRAGGHQGIDVTAAQDAARAVAEEVEKMTVGVATVFSYGGGSIYGYKNFPARLTYTLTSPVLAGGGPHAAWTPQVFLNELMAMRQALRDKDFYGPYKVYNSPNWDTVLDEDWKAQGDKTLRQRVGEVTGLTAPVTLQFLTGWTILMVQMTAANARAVVGMEPQTVQWEAQGGLQLCFKVMCILLPQLRANFYGNTGIMDGTATPPQS